MIEPKLMPPEEVTRRVDETLRGLNLPDDIIRWTSELKTGWQGYPLVRVVLVLRDGISATPRFRELSREWDLAMADALREAVPERWPILIYRSQSDQKELESGSLLL